MDLIREIRKNNGFDLDLDDGNPDIINFRRSIQENLEQALKKCVLCSSRCGVKLIALGEQLV